MPLSPAEIRELRGARTRRAFAGQLGVSLATVYLWEAGRMRPSSANLARLRGLVGKLKAIGGRARGVLRRGKRARPAKS